MSKKKTSSSKAEDISHLKQMKVSLNPHEHAVVTAAANIKGMHLRDYMRQAVIDQAKKDAKAFVKKNANNSISFIKLEDIGVNDWWGKAVAARGCFESNDGESVIMVFTTNGQTEGMFAKVGLDENGDLTLIEKSSTFSSNQTHSNISAAFVTETPYGYFYSHLGISGKLCGYFFASVGHDLSTITFLGKNNITHHPSSAPEPLKAVGARYNNGRGHAIITPLGTAYTAVVGPVVDENGLMSGQQWEANSSYWDAPLIGGLIPVNNSFTGQIGSSSVGSTCGAYCKAKHRFKNQPATVSLPAVVTADAYLINTSGDRWHNVAVNSTTFVPVPAPAESQPVVRAADDFWVSLGQQGDQYLYLFRDTDLVTRGALRDVVSAKAEKLKKEIDAQNSKPEEEEEE